MAYAAVISLKQTIERLLNSSHISLVSSSREIIEFAYKEATYLQQVLKRLDDRNSISSSKRLDSLDEEIREAVHKIEDLLELPVSDLFLSQSEISYGDHEGVFSLDLDAVTRQEINSLAEMVKKMEEKYIVEVGTSLPEEEEDDDDEAAASSNIDFGVEMVGLSDELLDIKYQIFHPKRTAEGILFSIVGKTGSGRSWIARSIFEKYIGEKQCFDCGAWVTIGSKYQFKEIILSILAQILINDRAVNVELVMSEWDEKFLGAHLLTSLTGRRYMIVLDDVCDAQILDKLCSLFPLEHNGSVILLTTSLLDVALHGNSYFISEIRTISDGVAWDTIRIAMFGLESTSAEFEVAGKMIIRNCGGLQISLLKVLVFLCQAEKTPGYWNKLAADKENPIFTVADEISEVRKIKEELCNLFPDDEINLNAEPPTNDNPSSGFTKVLFSSFSQQIEFYEKNLFPKRIFPTMEVISFIGMAGIGKTTFVKKIFEDPLSLHRFNHRVWVTLGPKYQSEDMLVDVLAQIYPDIDKKQMKGDAKLAKDLCAELSNKRCLIVLDDAWSKEPLQYLKNLFPDIKGKALLTTRLAKVAHLEKPDRVHKMRLLNKEESWDLLHQKVFAGELCPPKLEKAGKKIAENCDGLPLTIVTVANLLCEAEKTLEYWDEVAEGKNSLFMDAYNEISKTLLPRYKSIPQHLKACILYMGVFSQNYEIPTSKLIKCWSAEGFLEPNPSQTVEDFAAECLSDLVDRSLLLVCQKGSNARVKTCRVHSALWYLSNSEAVKNRFFHAFNTYVGSSMEGLENQRRLCIRNNALFGIKNVRDSIARMSTARSLLCTGPHHQYQAPICLNLRLLRILDALTIRFYEFPIQVVKLIHLRYLALTYNGKLPASISKLRNLHFLIVRRHLCVKSSRDCLYLPTEIWDMKELKHLQITGSVLPSPIDGAVLPNLSTLLDMSYHSCTEEALKGIPNLKRLRIEIELTPDDDGKSFHCLNHISRLNVLESLKCIVVNPRLNPEVAAPPAPISMFPPGLKKLSLSGLGYPWKYMSILGNLEYLEVLKLQCYAFRGREWETGDGNFMKLKYLSIEDTDLVCWKYTSYSFVDLKHLSIKHCYKLKEPPSYIAPCIKMIEIVDCHPKLLSWAKQQEEKNYLNNETRAHNDAKVHVHSSWDAGTPQNMSAHWHEKMNILRKNEISRWTDEAQRLNDIMAGDIARGIKRSYFRLFFSVIVFVCWLTFVMFSSKD